MLTVVHPKETKESERKHAGAVELLCSQNSVMGSVWPFATMRHEGAVQSVKFSPNGELLAVGDKTGQVLLYHINALSNQDPTVIQNANPDIAVADLRFSPDNKLLAMGNESGHLLVVDVKRGDKKIAVKHKHSITCIAFSPDSQLLVAGDTVDNNVIVRDASTGEEKFKYHYEGYVRCLCISPDGKLLVTGDDATLTVQELRETGSVIFTFAHGAFLRSVCFSPDGQQFMSGDDDGKVIIRDVSSGDTLICYQHSGWVRSVCFSPNGLYCAAGDTTSVVVRHVSTGDVISIFDHDKPVFSIDFSADSRLLAAGDESCALVVRSACSPGMTYAHKCEGEIKVVRFSPDSRFLACGDAGGLLTVRSVTSNKVVWQKSIDVSAVAFSSDSQILALGCYSGEVMLCNAGDGEVSISFKHTARVRYLCFSASGKYLAAADEAHQVVVRHTSTWQEAFRFSHDALSTCVVFSPDEKLIASADDSGRVMVRDITSIDVVIHSFQHDDAVWIVRFSPDGKLLVAGDEAKNTVIRTVDTGEEVQSYISDSDVTEVCFSPDGNILAVGDWNTNLVLRDFRTGNFIYKHGKGVTSVDFSQDGQLVALGDQCDQSYELVVFTNPLQFPPSAPHHELTGLFSRLPSLLLFPYKQGVNSGLTTPLHEISTSELAPIAKEIEGSLANICATRDNPRSPDVETCEKSALDSALEVKNFRKCVLMLSLMRTDIDVDDKDAGLARFLSKLPDNNDKMLESFLQRCIIASPNNIQDSLCRIASPEFRPCDALTQGGLFTDVGMFSNSPCAVETLAIGPPHFIRRTFPSVARNAAINVFETEVIQYTIEYLWANVRHLYYVQFGLFVTFVIAFSLGHYMNLFVLEDPSLVHLEVACSVSFVTTVFVALFFITQEMRELVHVGFCEYLADGWNWLELSAYLASLVSVSFTFPTLRGVGGAASNPYGNIVAAFSMMLVWVASLSHLRGFVAFGAIIATFVQILYDIRGFVGIVIILWLGGSLSFKVLLPGKPEYSNANGLATVYLMIMGDPMMDTLDVEVNETVIGIATPMQALATSTLAKIMALAFVSIVVVVLMNQLIALMGDSYDNVMENLRLETMRSRAKVIVTLLDLYGGLLKKKLIYPKWLHIIRPTKSLHGNNATGREWEGRVRALKSSISAVEGKLKTQFHSLESKMGTQMKGIKSNIVATETKLSARVGKLETKIDQLLLLLSQRGRGT